MGLDSIGTKYARQDFKEMVLDSVLSIPSATRFASPALKTVCSEDFSPHYKPYIDRTPY